MRRLHRMRDGFEITPLVFFGTEGGCGIFAIVKNVVRIVRPGVAHEKRLLDLGGFQQNGIAVNDGTVSRVEFPVRPCDIEALSWLVAQFHAFGVIKEDTQATVLWHSLPEFRAAGQDVLPIDMVKRRGRQAIADFLFVRGMKKTFLMI